jgi:hypothetical protein
LPGKKFYCPFDTLPRKSGPRSLATWGNGIRAAGRRREALFSKWSKGGCLSKFEFEEIRDLLPRDNSDTSRNCPADNCATPAGREALFGKWSKGGRLTKFEFEEIRDLLPVAKNESIRNWQPPDAIKIAPPQKWKKPRNPRRIGFRH